MHNTSWTVIAISGITCGGKTTLAQMLKNLLPHSEVINQDMYFYPDDSEKHIKVPNMDHNNYDIISSLDMNKMYNDIIDILNHSNSHNNDKKILIIEGFTVLNYDPIASLCNLKYQIVLSKEECLRRRALRVYDPPDIPGYFENCVWIEYCQYKEELQKIFDIVYLDGMKSSASLSDKILADIKRI